MKWIEIITLRSAGTSREFIEQKIPRTVTDEDRGENLAAIRMYRNATLDTDLSVHLLFASPRPEAAPSILGQRLASALKAFGLVNHSMWVEEEKK